MGSAEPRHQKEAHREHDSVDEALADVDDLVERTVGSGTAWSGMFFDVEYLEVELPDGSPARREIIRHPGGAGVLVVEDGKVCLVRQWRAPQGRVMLEIPAGKRDAGEDPSVTAARELVEETGLVAKRLVPIASTSAAPGFTDERTSVFFADGVSRSEAHPDEDEFADVVWVPVDDAIRAVRDGRIDDAKTVVALMAWASGFVKG